jgi:hypothetical protein
VIDPERSLFLPSRWRWAQSIRALKALQKTPEWGMKLMDSEPTSFWSRPAGSIRRVLLPAGLCLAALLTGGSAWAVSLFDGTTFTGWEGDTNGVWRIADGEIIAGSLEKKQPKNDFLCTTRRVAYLGGSITAAPGWRVQSLAWLQERFPQASFQEINAAIGGTGSNLGAFRVGQDAIAQRPDLVFIEFAVSDGGAAADQIKATMEGIVRQIRRADPATDICFVYTLAEGMVPDLRAGLFQRSASAMEAVAEHYQIPTVHFGVEVARRLADGTLVFKRKPEGFDPAAQPMLFSTDGVFVPAAHQAGCDAPPTGWGELVQVHDDRDIFQGLVDELPAIDIHSS